MTERSLEAPGSATPRLRRWIHALLVLTAGCLGAVIWARDYVFAGAPGAGAFFVTALGAVQIVSAYLCFEHAAVTGNRAYLHLAVASELSGALAIGWALATQGVLTPDTAAAGGSEPTILGRASAAVAFLMPIGTAAMALRRDRGRQRVTDHTIVRVAATTLAGALLWVVFLGVHAAEEPAAAAAAWHLVGATAIALVVSTATAVLLLRTYARGSILQLVLLLVVALTGSAVLVASFNTGRFTVGWYGAHVFALLACLALLIMLLGHLRVTDRERRRTVAELEELRLLADAANHELRFQAGTDALTGLANRHHFLSQVRRMIDRCAQRGGTRHLAVAVLDLDDFKGINDRCGHGAGDQVLQEVAFRITKHVRHSDVVGRLGGDEFGIAFGFSEPSQAQARLESIVTAIRKPILADGVEVTPDCSIGYSVCPQDGSRPGDLYRNADRAMYQAKQEGFGMPLPYAASMARSTERDSAVRADVTRGIAEGRITLAYQPILDLRHGGVWGFEALVRLTQPDGKVVTAGEFLPAVVAGAQLPALGHAVLDRLAADLPLIAALTDAKVTFNLSAQEAADASLLERLLGGDLAPFADRMVVEVSEGTLTDPHIEQALAALRQRGWTVAVDDFGTGMCNMATLEHTVPGVIKVDGEFTHGLDRSSAAAAVVRSAVDLGEGLGCAVIAEGVETPKQQALLPDLGVSLGQGFVLGRPIAPARQGEARPETWPSQPR